MTNGTTGHTDGPTKSNGTPAQLEEDNKLITSAIKIANIMNDWFIYKVKQIRDAIPNVNLVHFNACKKIMSGKQCNFSLGEVSKEEIEKVIKKLKPSKSTGADELDSFSLKISADIISIPVCHIVNLSLIQARFPKLWKYAKVLPLFKKHEKLLKENYCPVSNLSPVSKILERVVHEKVYDYFSQNSILHSNHHGFRKSRSTQTALLQLYDRWVRSANDGKLTGVVLLDLSAAFDLVDPAFLCENYKSMVLMLMLSPGSRTILQIDCKLLG